MPWANYKLRETVVEKKVVAYARKKGWTARKFTSPGKRSVADHVFMRYPAVLFYIEFKAPGKKPNKGQLQEHGEMRHCGFEVYVVDNVGEGMGIIDAETKKAEVKI